MLFAEHLGSSNLPSIPSYADYLRTHNVAKSAFSGAVLANQAVASTCDIVASVSHPLFRPFLESVSRPYKVANAVIGDYVQDPSTFPLQLDDITINGEAIGVEEDVVLDKAFGDVTHLRRLNADGTPLERKSPKVLVLVPHSGHDTSLLEDTIKTLIPDHEVYIGRFKDADHIPVEEGSFSFHDAVDYYQEYMEAVAGHGNTEQRAHIVAVCQPGPAALLAIAKMSIEDNPARPHSLIAHASPFDTRINPTVVNDYAREHDLSWFEENVVSEVPSGYGLKGEGRQVYWKYLQRMAFVIPNMDKHVERMREHWRDYLLDTDDANEAVEKHQNFINRYFHDIVSLDRDFYLQTVLHVFQQDTIADNAFYHGPQHLDLHQITDVAICAIEGETDDITGLGQCEAVLNMLPNVPESMKRHHVIPDTGHFGNWSGRKGRETLKQIDMRFMRSHDPLARTYDPLAKESLAKPKLVNKEHFGGHSEQSERDEPQASMA